MTAAPKRPCESGWRAALLLVARTTDIAATAGMGEALTPICSALSSVRGNLIRSQVDCRYRTDSWGWVSWDSHEDTASGGQSYPGWISPGALPSG